MKYPQLVPILAILVASLAFSQPVVAQSAQSNFTVNLTYLTVQLSYPAQVSPGATVTVNMQANTKSSSISSVSLTAQIYYATGVDLRQLTTATVVKNTYSGNSLTKQVQFSIPQDALRTSLMAVLTEQVQTFYATYYYYPTAHNNSSSYCYYSPYWSYNCYYGYANPSYSIDTSTDSGVAPLSYIVATTPEYTSLQSQYQSIQSQYQTAQQQYQALQQQLAQSQAQNQELNQNLQNAQNSSAQKDASITNLNQQLNTTQNTMTILEFAVAGFAILTVAFGAMALRKGKGQPQPTSDT
jgi:hypothetical protein